MDVHTIDLDFQRTAHTIAAYLLLGNDQPVLIETGPATTRAALIAGLLEHGVVPADIGNVFVTHIHLDHAGDAGWWAQQGARIYVHPVGAPHLADPSKLRRSAARIYGADMDRLWGALTPAPAGQLTTLTDGETVTIGDLAIQALDTPGHASHHFVYRVGNIAFTGDAAGIRTPSSPIVDLPAPPPEFNREQWLATLALLRQQNFSALYPTHFGRVAAVADQLDQMEVLIESAATLIRSYMDADMSRDQMVVSYRNWVKTRFAAHEGADTLFHEYETANPFFMTVDGLARYWRKRSSSPAPT